MLGVLLIYIIAMFFAVRKDREENEGPTIATEENQKMNNKGDGLPQLGILLLYYFPINLVI
jgi:hypothetical protein